MSEIAVVHDIDIVIAYCQMRKDWASTRFCLYEKVWPLIDCRINFKLVHIEVKVVLVYDSYNGLFIKICCT